MPSVETLASFRHRLLADLARGTMSANATEVPPETIPLYCRLVNTIFYLALTPVATVGNLLAIAVVFYIVRHHRTRRCIPDMGLGVLASVDLFSVLCVHSLTLVAMWQSWATLPNTACIFQAFSSSVYLKLQFLVQVAISMDRYFALVRPLRHHSFSSIKTMRIVLLALVLFSMGTTALTMAFAVDEIVPLKTWQFCIYEWRLRSAGDYLLVAVIGFTFAMGFMAFIGSNISLVRILWRYHAKRGDSVLREITHAVGAIDKEHRAQNGLQVPELKEPSSPNGHLAPHGRPSNCNQSNQFGARIGGGGGGRVGNGVDNGKGIENTERGLNRDKRQGSMLDQFGKGNSGNDSSATVAAHARLSSHAWPGGTLLTQLPAGNVAATGSKGQMLDMLDVKSPAATSSYVSFKGQEVVWKLGGSDLEESSALLGDDGTADTMCGHRKISPQTSTTPQDQSPNTRSSYLGETSEQELDALMDSPQNVFMDAICVPVPYSSNVSPLNLLARDSKDTLPVPKMHKSLSTNANMVSKCVQISLPKSKSLDEARLADVPNDSRVKRSSSNRVLPDIRKPSFSVSPPAMSTSRSRTRTSSHDTSRFPANFHIQVQPNGRTPSSSAASRPRLASSNASSTRHAQLAYFQHQVKKVLKKMQKSAHRHKNEMVLAKLVLLCAATFVVSWLPYVTVIILSVAGVTIHPLAEDIAIKLVFANAMLNPIFYGLCRRNYRKGYDYVSQLFCYRISCGCIKRPGEDKVFYESKKCKVKRHLAAAEMDAQEQMKRQQRHACALQILHHTLHLHTATLLPAATAAAAPVDPHRSPTEFVPSRRLQSLFERYMVESDSDSDSSSVDYDALVYGEEDLYQSLRHVWSMCINYGDVADTEADIELDIDYDALLAQDTGTDNVFLFPPNPVISDNVSEVVEENTEREVFPRLAMSTPNFERLDHPASEVTEDF